MDITELKADLNARVESVCEHLLPNGVKERHEWRVGSLQGERGKSLGVHLSGEKRGVWSDFQSGESGDLIDLWRLVKGTSLSEALDQIRGYLGKTRPAPHKSPRRDYKRPPKPKCTAPQGIVRDYLTEVRNIPGAILDLYKIGENGNLIVFPFLLPDGELALAKVREAKDGGKPRPTAKDCEPVLFGWQAIPEDAREVVITEGECLLGTTEVLTPDGWVALKDYSGGCIAQWQADDSLSWVKPVAKIERPYSGELLRFSDRFVTMTVTPGHRMPGLGRDNGRVSIVTAEEREVGTCKHHRLPRSGKMNGDGIGLSEDQIALILAISADAAIDVRKQSGATGRWASQDRYARVTLFKERKRVRLAGILDRLEIDYCLTENVTNGKRSDGTFFGIPLPNWVSGRLLPWKWIADATAAEREFILAELRHWDGNDVLGRNQHEFSTIHKANADWVQALCHTSGRCSTIMHRKNAYGEWLKVSILHGKRHSTYQHFKPARIVHDGYVYCLQVPSGMFLAREQSRVFVTGNCDALSMAAYGHHAMSVPFGGGGGGKQQWIENEFERMERFERIYLATDMDKPGEEAANEIASRLGRHRCYRVTLPRKDANECLMDGVSRELIAAAIKDAKSLDPEGLRRADEFTEAVVNLFWPQPGVHLGYKTPYGKLGDKLLFRPGELTLWTGASGSGKSQILSDCSVDWIKQGARICISSLEMKGAQALKRMVKQATGVERPSERGINAALHWMAPNLLLYDFIGKASVARLLEIFTYARAKYACDTFIVDSLMRLGIPNDDYSAQESAAFEMVEWTTNAEVHMHLVAHSRKGTAQGGVAQTEDVKGASEIGSNAFNIISIWRNRELEDEIAKLELGGNSAAADAKRQEKPGVIGNVAKQRNGDFEGKFGLWFDKETYQYQSSHERSSWRRCYIDPDKVKIHS